MIMKVATLYSRYLESSLWIEAWKLWKYEWKLFLKCYSWKMFLESVSHNGQHSGKFLLFPPLTTSKLKSWNENLSTKIVENFKLYVLKSIIKIQDVP